MVIAAFAVCGLFLFSSLFLYLGLVSKYIDLKADVEGFKRSTHSVQLIDTSNKEEMENIKKYQKEYQEEAQEAYPEFATFDEDLESRGLNGL